MSTCVKSSVGLTDELPSDCVEKGRRGVLEMSRVQATIVVRMPRVGSRITQGCCLEDGR